MSVDTAKAVVVSRTLTAKFDHAVMASRPFYPRLCTVIPSDGADENYGSLGSMPGMREWVGDRVFNELLAATYVLRNKEYEGGLLIKKNDIADDRMALYPALIESLAAEATYHPDELLFALLVAAESTAGWDGQYYFDTDHSMGESGTQSNDLTYNAADHTAVTAVEFLAAYHAARLKIVKYVNDAGKLLNRPVIGAMGNFMVLVPPELRQAAQTAIDSIIISNSTNIVLDKPQIVESAHLTDATKFYLFNLNSPLKPFIFQARRPLSRQTKGEDDHETKDVKFMVDARYNVGFGPWWQAVLTTFN